MTKLPEILLFVIAIFVLYIAIDIARYTDFAKTEMVKQTSLMQNLKLSQFDVIFKSGTLIINEKEVIK